MCVVRWDLGNVLSQTVHDVWARNGLGDRGFTSVQFSDLTDVRFKDLGRNSTVVADGMMGLISELQIDWKIEP